MTSEALLNHLYDQRPKYSSSKKSFMETFSQKGAKGGSSKYTSFGPYYETYIYAFFTGFHRNERTEIIGEKIEFLDFGKWKPESYTKYIIMLIITRHSLDFNWNIFEIEKNEDILKEQIVKKIITYIEEYANAGLIYLENYYNENPHEFEDPFVFLNLMKSISNKCNIINSDINLQ